MTLRNSYIARVSFRDLEEQNPESMKAGRRVQLARWAKGIPAGWLGLAGFWFTFIVAGLIGAVLLQVLGPPPAAPARQLVAQPSPPQAAPPASPQIESAAAREPAPPSAPASVRAPASDPALAAAAAVASQVKLDPPLADDHSSPPPPSPPASASSSVPAPIAPGDRAALAPSAAATKTAQNVATPKPRAEPATSEATGGPTGGKSFILHYLAGSPTAELAVQRFTTRLGITHAEMHPEATVPRSALVRYVYGEDHAAAREAGKALAEMGYIWRIENAPDRPGAPAQGVIEAWLPSP